MFLTVVRYMQAHQMALPGDRIIVGVSGGADSMVLLHILKRFAGQADLMLFAAHLNHGLRPESAREEDLVHEVCNRWQIPFYSEKVDVADEACRARKSLEEAGRDCRYRYFAHLAQQLGANRIATAHHQNDQAESVLLHLLRGSGIRGLQGMLPVNGELIRPLLCVDRQRIEQYAREHHIPYCQDESNQDPVFMRNRIRLKLIPFLEQDFNPRIVDGLNRLAAIAQEENQALEQYTEQLWPQVAREEGDSVQLSIPELARQPAALQNRLIYKALREVSGSSDWGGNDIRRIRDLLTGSGSSRVLKLGHHTQVGQVYDRLLLARHLKESPPFCYSATIPGQVDIPETGITYVLEVVDRERWEPQADTTYLDMDQLSGPFLIRSRQKGDRFSPVGFTGSKSLKKYFMEQKIPARERNKIPLFVSGQKIYAVLGHRVDQQAAVKTSTQRILVIKALPDVKTREVDPPSARNCLD